MIRLYLIRHGQTPGNKLQRYIGTTDEPLSTEGKEFLEKLTYPMPEALYVSPLCRCVETAGILFPGKSFHIIEELSECDFGEFENKNYKELSGNQDYQRWIDSGGTLPFPGGEALTDFKKRSVRAFLETVSKSESILKGQVTSGKQDDTTVAYVVHGGTIMAVLSELCGGDYYDYHCGNGEGYLCSLTKDKRLSVIGKISARNGCEIHGTVLE